ncbi:MAG: hypothetical protein K6C37_02660 [Bacteroidales bacterium]|nr:hypothetical protein [Bacteroidales bacterium]
MSLLFPFSSCKGKEDVDSPTAENVDFDIEIRENRHGRIFIWNVDKSGRTDSVEEDIDDLYVTKFNSVELAVSSPDPLFSGVGMESSASKVVSVKRTGDSTFRLAYEGDGEADILVWTGSKNGPTSRRIHVRGKREIHLKGIWMSCQRWHIDLEKETAEKVGKDTVFLVKEVIYNEATHSSTGGTKIYLGKLNDVYYNENNFKRYTFETWYEFRTLKLEPENASLRYLKSAMTDFDTGYDASNVFPEYWKALSIHPDNNWFHDVNDYFNQDVDVVLCKSIFLHETEQGLLAGIKTYADEKGRVSDDSSYNYYSIKILNSTYDGFEFFTLN